MQKYTKSWSVTKPSLLLSFRNFNAGLNIAGEFNAGWRCVSCFLHFSPTSKFEIKLKIFLTDISALYNMHMCVLCVLFSIYVYTCI